MSRETGALGQLEFLQALVKRGFVPIPRMLFDYGPYLELDYDTIGKIFSVLALVGDSNAGAFGDYTISRKEYPHDFNLIRNLLADLEEKDLVRWEEEPDQIAFSFIPLYSRLRALWGQDRERQEKAAAKSKDPAIEMAEQLLGRPLSDREVADILDWVDTYGFGTDMVKAVIDEGKNQGVLRMTYLNGIARQWFEKGIRTPEQAAAHAAQYRQALAKYKRIIRYLGLGSRPLTQAEIDLLDKWTEEWGFSEEVVIRAAEAATGRSNPLQYMNRVLESWRASGVRSLADVERLLAERKNRLKSEGSKTAGRRATVSSNVLLHREKKDDDFYDHLYKKFGE